MDAVALNEFMASAFQRELSWVIEHVGADGVTVRQPVGSGDLRPGGTVSGPTLMALADGVAYMVLLSQIGPAALAVTSNLNINFLRRPRPTDLVTKGRLLKLGRSLALVEVSMYSALDQTPEDSATFSIDENSPLAHATVTYSLALLGGSETPAADSTVPDSSEPRSGESNTTREPSHERS
ncbi:MAG TPA: PaaI family thioesterase [Microthrixaceae bacterium]|nr:PaaI family thioesterase [Microthrixaceae bacterium]